MVSPDTMHCSHIPLLAVSIGIICSLQLSAILDYAACLVAVRCLHPVVYYNRADYIAVWINDM